MKTRIEFLKTTPLHLREQLARCVNAIGSMTLFKKEKKIYLKMRNEFKIKNVEE